MPIVGINTSGLTPGPTDASTRVDPVVKFPVVHGGEDPDVASEQPAIRYECESVATGSIMIATRLASGKGLA